MRKLILAISFLFAFSIFSFSATNLPALRAEISVSAELKKSFLENGRIILHITKKKEKEPRFGSEIIIGTNAVNWNSGTPFLVDSKSNQVMIYASVGEDFFSSGTFYYQVVYKQNLDDGQENVPGNLFSNVDSTQFSPGITLKLNIDKLIPPFEIISHKFVLPVFIKSKLLSDFSGRTRYLRAAVLLPSGYFNHPEKSYPICYRAPGLNGRSTAVKDFVNNPVLSNWWFSEEALQIIYVFLDSQGPYGDTYQVDSENNGPCGRALTEELIPAIEKQVRYDVNSHNRFVVGCSTGGWVALGLQVLYPDFFDGTWSFSPDPVDFEHFGLINMYADESIFYNRYGYLQPGRRTIYDEPTRSMADWISNENVVSRTGSYLVSGGQFGAYNAVFSPKGKDGLPALTFDPLTGKIDHEIARQWEKYDIKKILAKNWSVLGPKLQGKIWVWTGDMDGLYSNVATRFLKDFLDKTENPKSDASINFTPMAGHCQEWSDKKVLILINERISNKMK